MSKKYKLLKDHPYAKAGTVLKENYNNGEVKFFDVESTNLARGDINIPLSVEKEWLEPVETRWRPVAHEAYFFIDDQLTVYKDTSSEMIDINRIGVGNCFCTREQAEEAAKRIKACLEAYHEEIGE